MTLQPDEPQALTLRNVRRDFPEWHLGRPTYALWALHFDAAALQPRVRLAQQHLAPWLLKGYQRQPHITLSLCGFPTLAPQHPDDYGPQQFQAQLAALQALRAAPFEMAIGALESFSSVPYFTVQEPAGHLLALRRCLEGRGSGAAPDDYTPHVTVGLYAGAWPLQRVQAELARLQLPAPLRVQVSGVSLLSYTASEIGGRLRCMADFLFERGTLHWHEEHPFNPQ